MAVFIVKHLFCLTATLSSQLSTVSARPLFCFYPFPPPVVLFVPHFVQPPVQRPQQYNLDIKPDALDLKKKRITTSSLYFAVCPFSITVLKISKDSQRVVQHNQSPQLFVYFL